MRALFTELSRRNVLRVAAAYLVFGWVVLQVVDVVGPILELRASFARIVLLLLAIGFVAAIVISWIYELTPEGLKRTDDVPASESVAPATGKRLDRMLLAGLAIAVGILLLDRFAPRTADESTTPVSATQPAASALADKSIAVLPFTNLAPSADTDPFVDGIHEDLLTQLAKISALKVISRTSVQEYRQTSKNLRQIADELHVATILEGGVQRSGTRVRINAQLIDAHTDRHLWAETYDRELTADNLFDIQSEIARAITAALRANLLPEEAARIATALTGNLEALEAYRVALVAINQGDPASLDAADRQLDRAIALDPRFAAAYALRAQGLLTRYWIGEPSPDLLAQARAAIAAGRSIEPKLPELDVAEAYLIYRRDLDFPRALELAEAANALLPGDVNPMLLRAYILRRLARWDEAVALFQRIVELDPRNARAYLELALTYAYLHDYAAGARAIESVLTLDPEWGDAHYTKAMMMLETGAGLPASRAEAARGALDRLTTAWVRWWLALASGDYESALALSDFGEFSEDATSIWSPELVRGLTLKLAGREDEAALTLAAAVTSLEPRAESKPTNPAVLCAYCITLGASGQRDRAISACDRALAAAPADALQEGDLRVELAMGLALAGESERAIDLIDAALSRPTVYGAVYLEHDPAFASLRNDPRFRDTLERHRWRGEVPHILRPSP